MNFGQKTRKNPTTLGKTLENFSLRVKLRNFSTTQKTSVSFKPSLTKFHKTEQEQNYLEISARKYCMACYMAACTQFCLDFCAHMCQKTLAVWSGQSTIKTPTAALGFVATCVVV